MNTAATRSASTSGDGTGEAGLWATGTLQLPAPSPQPLDMHPLDWAIVAAYLTWIIWDGLRLTKKSNELEGYLLASRSLPWWAVGLSVMATQLSAITMIGTTGQGYADGMRLLQMYFALPIAMVVLSVTLVPFFHNARVFTAYEYLERRFDAKTRTLTAFLFLLSRAMTTRRRHLGAGGRAVGGAGLSVTTHVPADGVADGGLHDVRRRAGRGLDRREADGADRVRPAGGGGRAGARACPTPWAWATRCGWPARPAACRSSTSASTSPSRYTFWSGTIAAFFLFCSYFGTDQSQVQRYLSAKSVDEARTSLLMSAYWKIPLQALVLLVGVLMFVFYVFTPPPMLFNAAHEAQVRASARGGRVRGCWKRSSPLRSKRSVRPPSAHAMSGARRRHRRPPPRERVHGSHGRHEGRRAAEAVAIVKDVSGRRGYNDVNYVFPTFVLTQPADGARGPADRRDPGGGHVRRRRPSWRRSRPPR